jgi:hypothetical protein
MSFAAGAHQAEDTTLSPSNSPPLGAAPVVPAITVEGSGGRSIPTMQGPLKKLPSAVTGSISSQKRYATVTTAAFTYYHSLTEYMANSRGKSIPLLGAAIKVPQRRADGTYGALGPKARCTFTIITPSGAKWTFETRDTEDNKVWYAD